MKFLQYTEWSQPFIRRGDTEVTQFPDRQASINIADIANITEDVEEVGCALIWLRFTGEIGTNRPRRARESVTQLTAIINGLGE
jgi:hypothetical protein